MLESILLDKIYGLYLDVLACLPMDDLRRRYHGGFLKADHCYGPFENPVHNIVLSTILVYNLMRYCPSSCGSAQTVPGEFKAEQSFICGKVNDALKKYNQRTRLHDMPELPEC
ncbi:hypothetical protein E2562_020271 [Oryza meyeriana var. granulata]|uniref:PIR2-like helical domain-containing protein n=1 Tax=Oryza meyeriana var. granulata TaxID=110450 RepID=A0A6G1DKZ6_9ORYZ|nr:hypothetical protein E2562_020271 [Oryza meyeriana var. granulata]